MTALGLIAGKVWRAPEGRTAKNGKSFATAVMREGTGAAVTWWSIVAFAESATELLQLKAGDVLSVSGPFTVEIYTKDGGQPRISHRIVADRIAAPRLSGRRSAA
jgi:single-stranded DNA-binding protein